MVGTAAGGGLLSEDVGAVVLKKTLLTVGMALAVAPLMVGLSAGAADAREVGSSEVAARAGAAPPGAPGCAPAMGCH